MINLLPPQQKREFLLDRTKTLIIILGWILIIALLSLAMVLFALRFYILSQVNNQSSLFESANRAYQTSDISSFNAIIKKYNTNLSVIDAFYKKQTYVTDILKDISSVQRPQGLVLTGIDVAPLKKDTKLQITVYGTSNTRDNLLLFKDHLEHDTNITNVYFPPESWIKPTDVTFYATFNVNPN